MSADIVVLLMHSIRSQLEAETGCGSAWLHTHDRGLHRCSTQHPCSPRSRASSDRDTHRAMMCCTDCDHDTLDNTLFECGMRCNMQEPTCLGMSRTFRVDKRSGRTGGSSGLSPTRTISLTVRKGQLPCRVTQGCFIILPSVMRSLGFCNKRCCTLSAE